MITLLLVLRQSLETALTVVKDNYYAPGGRLAVIYGYRELKPIDIEIKLKYPTVA